MARLLQEVRPTVVVCTFPGAAAAMSMLKENGLTDLPLVTVITDHTDHSYWLHPCTDRYIVGSEHVKEALMGHQIPESRIAVTGIPIRPRFVGRFDRGTLRRKYGLHPDLPTVLVMGGGLGMIGREFTETLRSSDIMETMQVIFVCGQNEKLKQQLDGEFRGCRGVLTTGYVDHIHELMALSDLLITKPGGLTTSEAVAMELPMLLHKPLPGQEQDNAAYLVKSGVAVMAGSGAELAGELVKLIESPLLLSAIRQQAKRHERKHAAFQALEAILATKPTYWPAKVRRAVYARA
ncbi:hypothetical protein N6H14_03860 [Paenibacillus sp. CC-CFT747]|nr:hypothetical protein N6H14_03860 [Paenibacillus sp. CC-CFT747]